MPGNEPTSSEPNMCQSTEPSIQCPIHVPRAPTVFTKIETGIDETPGYPQVRRQLVCQPHTEQRTEQDDGPTRLNVCPRIGGAHAWAHSTNGLGVSGPISGLRAIAMRISPCSRAGGTQMVGTPVERTAASVLLSHTRDTTCPRSCRPRASATTDGQSPPPRALIRATIEWRRATRASGIPVSPQPAMHAKVCCVTEMILPEFQQGMGLFENLHEHKIRPRRV